MKNESEKIKAEEAGSVESQTEDHGQIVIEASWAPKDPRDKLYDSSATDKERATSLIRIIAAFHPVLNAPVLCYDLLKMIGAVWSMVIFAIAISGFMYLIFG
ncbi:MAG: hypothetical protein HWE08_14605 [Alphaproteobacteria bacterium]|nr:hypothetical protein [Alphaproteobacteria bacterium]